MYSTKLDNSYKDDGIRMYNGSDYIITVITVYSIQIFTNHVYCYPLYMRISKIFPNSYYKL